MKTSKKKELEQEIAILKRTEFLNVYSEFNKWLFSIGFREGHYWNESSTSSDVHYSHYDKFIDSLYSVEHYVHDTLKLSIRFMRDRYEHKFMFVGMGLFGGYSAIYTLEQTKELILNKAKEIKAEKLSELNAVNIN